MDIYVGVSYREFGYSIAIRNGGHSIGPCPSFTHLDDVKFTISNEYSVENSYHRANEDVPLESNDDVSHNTTSLADCQKSMLKDIKSIVNRKLNGASYTAALCIYPNQNRTSLKKICRDIGFSLASIIDEDIALVSYYYRNINRLIRTCLVVIQSGEFLWISFLCCRGLDVIPNMKSSISLHIDLDETIEDYLEIHIDSCLKQADALFVDSILYEGERSDIQDVLLKKFGNDKFYRTHQDEAAKGSTFCLYLATQAYRECLETAAGGICPFSIGISDYAGIVTPMIRIGSALSCTSKYVKCIASDEANGTAANTLRVGIVIGENKLEKDCLLVGNLCVNSKQNEIAFHLSKDLVLRIIGKDHWLTIDLKNLELDPIKLCNSLNSETNGCEMINKFILIRDGIKNLPKARILKEDISQRRDRLSSSDLDGIIRELQTSFSIHYY